MSFFDDFPDVGHGRIILPRGSTVRAVRDGEGCLPVEKVAYGPAPQRAQVACPQNAARRRG
jgi:hypothetical protein